MPTLMFSTGFLVHLVLKQTQDVPGVPNPFAVLRNAQCFDLPQYLCTCCVFCLDVSLLRAVNFESTCRNSLPQIL